jgi:hypothetical protein
MWKSIRHFIVKIQNSDESVRTRWLFVLSGTSMAIVVALWIGYINLIVTPPTAPAAAAAEDENPGFADIMRAGATVIKGALAEKSSAYTRYIRMKIGQKNTVTIEGSERNFILDELEPVPPASLP